MKILKTHIDSYKSLGFFKWLGFCCVFLTSATLFFTSSNLNYLIFQHGGNYTSSTNALPKHSASLHSYTHEEAGILLTFSSVEETEPSDETSEDKDIQSCFALRSKLLYKPIFSLSSFASFNLSLQKRSKVPLFLLQHSLKIPNT